MTDIGDYEAFEIIAAYLERQGVTDLRQRHQPDQVNRSAVLRYLIAEKLQEALDNPPPASQHLKRSGPPRRTPRRTPISSSGKKRK